MSQNIKEQIKILAKSVHELDLSVRASNCLQKANIITIGELAYKTEKEMLRIKNFGKKSLTEVKVKLAKLGLRLNLKTDYSKLISDETLFGEADFLKQSIDVLDLSYRAQHWLKQNKIETIGTLIKKSATQLLNIRNLGRKSVREIKCKLAEYLESINSKVKEEPKVIIANNFYDALVKIIEKVFSPLEDRTKEIMKLRYGLKDDHFHTLESIGNRFNITRERVRQIEQKTMKRLRRLARRKIVSEYLEKLVAQFIIPFIKQSYGIITRDEINVFLSKKYSQKEEIQLSSSFLSKVYFDNRPFFTSFLTVVDDGVYAVDIPSKILYKQVIEWAKRRLKIAKKPMALIALSDKILKDNLSYTDKATKYFTERFVKRCLLITKDIGRDKTDLFGLWEWDYFHPTRLKDMVKRTLFEVGESAHFTQITLLMNELYPNKGPFKPHNINATLQRFNEIFVWIKPGVYGLKTWGLKRPPYVIDYLVKLLRQANKPLHIGYLNAEVLQVSNCRESSIQITLEFRDDIFVKYLSGFYGLRDWEEN